MNGLESLSIDNQLYLILNRQIFVRKAAAAKAKSDDNPNFFQILHFNGMYCTNVLYCTNT